MRSDVLAELNRVRKEIGLSPVVAVGFGGSNEVTKENYKHQLRDKNGKWIPMGGEVKWAVQGLEHFGFVKAFNGQYAVVDMQNKDGSSTPVQVHSTQVENIDAKAHIPGINPHEPAHTQQPAPTDAMADPEEVASKIARPPADAPREPANTPVSELPPAKSPDELFGAKTKPAPPVLYHVTTPEAAKQIDTGGLVMTKEIGREQGLVHMDEFADPGFIETLNEMQPGTAVVYRIDTRGMKGINGDEDEWGLDSETHWAFGENVPPQRLTRMTPEEVAEADSATYERINGKPLPKTDVAPVPSPPPPPETPAPVDSAGNAIKEGDNVTWYAQGVAHSGTVISASRPTIVRIQDEDGTNVSLPGSVLTRADASDSISPSVPTGAKTVEDANGNVTGYVVKDGFDWDAFDKDGNKIGSYPSEQIARTFAHPRSEAKLPDETAPAADTKRDPNGDTYGVGDRVEAGGEQGVVTGISKTSSTVTFRTDDGKTRMSHENAVKAVSHADGSPLKTPTQTDRNGDRFGVGDKVWWTSATGRETGTVIDINGGEISVKDDRTGDTVTQNAHPGMSAPGGDFRLESKADDATGRAEGATPDVADGGHPDPSAERADNLRSRLADIRGQLGDTAGDSSGAQHGDPRLPVDAHDPGGLVAQLRDEAKPIVDELNRINDADLDPSKNESDDPRFGAPTLEPVGGMTDAQHAELGRSYALDDAATIANNASLRSDNPSDEALAWADKISEFVNDSRLTDDAVLFRGAALTPDEIAQLRPGATITDHGFLSTDSNYGRARGYADYRGLTTAGTSTVVFRIQAPEGTSAASIRQSPGEIVLDRDSTMHVRSVAVHPDGTRDVTVDLQPTGETTISPSVSTQLEHTTAARPARDANGRPIGPGDPILWTDATGVEHDGVISQASPTSVRVQEFGPNGEQNHTLPSDSVRLDAEEGEQLPEYKPAQEIPDTDKPVPTAPEEPDEADDEPSAPAPSTPPADDWHSVQLTDSERAAITRYTGHDNRQINGGLRRGYVSPEAKQLDQVMSRSKTDKPVTVYRSMLAGDIHEFTPGAEFSDKGFVSTTPDEAEARKFLDPMHSRTASDPNTRVLFKIDVPAGTHAIDVNAAGGRSAMNPKENEILLDRGSRFSIDTVTSEEIDGQTVQVVTAHVVGNDTPAGPTTLRPTVDKAGHEIKVGDSVTESDGSQWFVADVNNGGVTLREDHEKLHSGGMERNVSARSVTVDRPAPTEAPATETPTSPSVPTTAPTGDFKPGTKIPLDENGVGHAVDADGKRMYKGDTVVSRADGVTGTIKTIESNGAYVKIEVTNPDGSKKVYGRKLSTLDLQDETPHADEPQTPSTPAPTPEPQSPPTPAAPEPEAPAALEAPAASQALAPNVSRVDEYTLSAPDAASAIEQLRQDVGAGQFDYNTIELPHGYSIQVIKATGEFELYDVNGDEQYSGTYLNELEQPKVAASITNTIQSQLDRAEKKSGTRTPKPPTPSTPTPTPTPSGDRIAPSAPAGGFKDGTKIPLDEKGVPYAVGVDGNKLYKGDTVKSRADGLTAQIKTIEANGQYVKVQVNYPDGTSKTFGRKLSTLDLHGAGVSPTPPTKTAPTPPIPSLADERRALPNGVRGTANESSWKAGTQLFKTPEALSSRQVQSSSEFRAMPSGKQETFLASLSAQHDIAGPRTAGALGAVGLFADDNSTGYTPPTRTMAYTASAYGRSRIYFSRNTAMGTPKEQREHELETQAGFHPAHAHLDVTHSTIAHEYGHHVELSMLELDRTRQDDFWRRLFDRLDIELPEPGGLSTMGDRDAWVRSHETEVSDAVGRYAATSAHELFADIWGVFSTMGSSGPGDIYDIGLLMQYVSLYGKMPPPGQDVEPPAQAPSV